MDSFACLRVNVISQMSKQLIVIDMWIGRFCSKHLLSIKLKPEKTSQRFIKLPSVHKISLENSVSRKVMDQFYKMIEENIGTRRFLFKKVVPIYCNK